MIADFGLRIADWKKQANTMSQRMRRRPSIGTRFRRLLKNSAIRNPQSAILLCALLFALGAPVWAQEPAKIPRIGYLTNTPFSASEFQVAFRQGLRDLGYIEGKNIIIEWRSGEQSRERQRAIAAEFVRLNVDIIVAGGSGDIRAAKEATSTIPIVMVTGGDVIGSGFVASLSRPGGNITGLSTLRPELMGKRLELLKEILPKLSRVALIISSSSQDYTQIVREVDVAAGARGIKLQHLDIQGGADFEHAFRTAAKGRAEAALVRIAGPLLGTHRTRILELAVKHRLPAMYERAEEVLAGGLVSYGINTVENYRRAATYVDKILKGRSPVDLPVEQPTKFEFLINLKAAKHIGLTIPPNVLARAYRVIR
jgi:putative ABC transport system substrate-binding protein